MMALPRARARQRGGAVTIIMVQLAMLFVIFLLVALYVGDWSRQRAYQQNQADAISLVAMQIARSDGIDAVCGHPAMNAVLLGNLPPGAEVDLEDCGAFVEVERDDGSTALEFQANTLGTLSTADAPYARPFLQLEDRAMRVAGEAGMAQESFDQAEENLAQFVLVLDFSGSMRINFGRRPRYQVLQQVVTNLLNRNLPIEYGLVNYSGDVLDTVPIGPNNVAQIIDVTNRRGPDGMTNYQAAVDRATQLLRATGSERLNMLFISDGEPTVGGDAVAAANRARDAGILIFTLMISDGNPDILIDMSGRNEPPEDYANERFFFTANNPGELEATFDAIIAEAACTVGPIDFELAPGDIVKEKVFAVLKDEDDRERAMRYAPNVNAEGVADTFAFNFDITDRTVRISRAACREILDNNNRVVVRHGDLNLIGAR